MKFEMPAAIRDGHPYFMHDELHEQPAALRQAIAAGRSAAAQWSRHLPGRRIYLTGCGTSFHAAMTAEYWLRVLRLAHFAQAVEAFELATGGYRFGDDSLVVAFSQSGAKGATVAAIQLAREQGATILAVSGHTDRALAHAADEVLGTGYSRETSWAHTISYTASLAAFLSLALSLDASDAELVEQLDRIPEAVDSQLRDESRQKQLAAQYSDLPRVFVIGGAGNYGTALEAALKLRETSYVHADAEGPEYFLHGPVSSLDEKSLLIAIAPPGEVRQRVLSVLRAARTIGARTLALGEIGDDELEDTADDFIDLPPLRAELTPLLYVVPLHLFSYWRAVQTGFNPDLIRRDQRAYREAREGYDL
jgi:glucosamine 6-phosphate synthetase-like amidotransferase/phosphosugar isomerase protein